MLSFAAILTVAAVSCVQAQNKYFLYTRQRPASPYKIINLIGQFVWRGRFFFHFLKKNDGRLLLSNWNESVQFEPTQLHDATSPGVWDLTNKTMLLIHGHGGSVGSQFNSLIRFEIIKSREVMNIVVVDWEFSAGASYSTASRNVPSVAQDLAHFLKSLGPKVDMSKLHIIGFDLGAHVAGIASRLLNPNLAGRITGLDPSGSGWDTNSQRLRSTDAHYVEVIHTDGSGLLSNGIGTAIGHINFYANCGRNQPGCWTNTCSHNRAYELFAASINGHHLEGYPCRSMTKMKWNLCGGSPLKMGGTELDKKGQTLIYRINTRKSYPF